MTSGRKNWNFDESLGKVVSSLDPAKIADLETMKVIEYLMLSNPEILNSNLTGDQLTIRLEALIKLRTPASY